MTPYPVNLVVEGRPVLVVGGGRVATGKVRRLVEAGAHVTCVAPEVSDDIVALGVDDEHRLPLDDEVDRVRGHVGLRRWRR